MLGAKNLLATHRPNIVLETHALELLGIRGSIAELCALLEQLDDPLLDLERADLVTPDVYAHPKVTEIGCLLASDRLARAGFR